MKPSVIIGVDVSKLSLDLFARPSAQAISIDNTRPGFKKWLKGLKQLIQPGDQVLVIMEHTGKYSLRFESFLQEQNLPYCKLPALEIKRSMGLVRGKTDRIDAQRIADYAWLRRETLAADQPTPAEVTTLRDLLSLRSKIVRDRSGYLTRIKEMKFALADPYLIHTQQRIIKALTKEIEIIEEKIKSLIASNANLKRTADLLMSIKGVGWIVASHMIAYTNNFTRFSNARKFNCYAGLAPFDHQSGTSIRGRARVSHLANKGAKTMLNLAASAAIRSDHELKTYYQRRVGEGKRKMSCLNIVRCKLVARMFAVVKRQTAYQPLAA